MAKQVVYLAPGILAKLAADPAIRQAVLAPMERDAELACDRMALALRAPVAGATAIMTCQR